MPVNVDEVRLKVAGRQRLTTDELEALIDAEGWFVTHRRVRTAGGFIILFGEPAANDPMHRLTPHIEVTQQHIRIMNPQRDPAIYREAAQLAASLWGAGGTVLVTGPREVRDAARAAGLVVINNNPSARAWRVITGRRIRRPVGAHAPGPARPQGPAGFAGGAQAAQARVA